MIDNKRTSILNTIPDKMWITRTVVWALGINARGIRMALFYIINMILAAFVNMWKITRLLSQDKYTTYAIEDRENKMSQNLVLVIFEKLCLS